MSEIAKCPICGKEPEVWCRDEEIRIRIVCCKHAAYSTLGWNQYAAAMELAKLTYQMKTCRAYCPERAHLQAQDRILETFALMEAL